MGATSIHEFDELSLFHELGHEFFDMGSYVNPLNPIDRKRPPIQGAKYHPHLVEVYGHSTKDDLHPELIEPHDVIIDLHIPRWIERNWDKIKHKKVIWRCNGQSSEGDERIMKKYREAGMKIVRWSPMEKNIPNYIGEDIIIRHYKDHYEYQGWSGHVKQVITLAQNMVTRGEFCNWRVFNQVTMGFQRKLYGPDNENSNIEGGELSFPEIKKALRDNRVFFYAGTQPASYTLGFIEAWITGIPIVAIGKKLGNSLHLHYETYEIPYLIENGVSGFISDDITELRSYIARLLDDYDLAKRIGEAGRLKAIEVFGKEKAKEGWKKFFSSL